MKYTSFILKKMQKFPLFIIDDSAILKTRYNNVASAQELTKKILLLTNSSAGNVDVSTTSLYHALKCFFDEDVRRLTVFVDSLVDSATSVLDQYKKEQHNAMFPLEPAHWTRSRSECRGLLANAFLGNIGGDPVAVKKVRQFRRGKTGLKFYDIMSEDGSKYSQISSQKILCLIQYFQSTERPAEDMLEENKDVVFDRINVSMEKFLALPGWKQPKISNRIFADITTAPMETKDATSMVNFANKLFGVGQFLGCCTQEEILQMCCPEINVGMLVHGEMNEDTVVVVRNAKRFSKYSGYLQTFRFEGREVDNFPPQTIIFMDASITTCHGSQFTLKSNLRDIRKAYLGFLGSAATSLQLSDPTFVTTPDFGSSCAVISTGQWGCGAFGGNQVLKCLQQMVAASLLCDTNAQKLAVKLIFSSFRNASLQDLLRRVVALSEGLTPEQLLNHVLTKDELFRGNYQELFQTLADLNSVSHNQDIKC